MRKESINNFFSSVLLMTLCIVTNGWHVASAQGGCVVIGWSGGEYGYSIIQTNDGGYAIAGSIPPTGAVYVVKLSPAGDTMWTRIIGSPYRDDSYSIIQSLDGGYAIVGYYGYPYGGGNVGNADLYVIKLSSNGDTMWTRTIGGTGWEEGWSIIQINDSGYAITGSTSLGPGNENVYVIKLNANGDTMWTRIIGGADYHEGHSIIQTADGGFALTGRTSFWSAGSFDVYVLKLDNNGNLQWTKTIGGMGWDEGWSIINTLDGGYVIAGWTQSFGSGGSDVYIIKLNANGDTVWTRVIGGNSNDYGYSLIQTNDGGYIIAGSTESFGAGGSDVYVIKLDSSGNLQWTRTIGGNNTDIGRSIIRTADNGYAVVGWTNSLSIGGT